MASVGAQTMYVSIIKCLFFQNRKYIQIFSYKGAEMDVIKLIAENGPVSVSVDATNWQDYMGGIIQHHCGSVVNHAVTVVGYNLERRFSNFPDLQCFIFADNPPYYIVRNSWGTDFGHEGYVYVEYGTNMCAIAGRVVSLTVK